MLIFDHFQAKEFQKMTHTLFPTENNAPSLYLLLNMMIIPTMYTVYTVVLTVCEHFALFLHKCDLKSKIFKTR